MPVTSSGQDLADSVEGTREVSIVASSGTFVPVYMTSREGKIGMRSRMSQKGGNRAILISVICADTHVLFREANLKPRC